jgi:hypothetical protein
MITRTTKITIETEAMLVVRHSRTVMAWCPKCQAEVEAVVCEDASIARLLREAGAPSLHVLRPAGSSTRICLPSLLQLSQPGQVQQAPIPAQTLPTREKDKHE